jgi:hypothetical protein
MLILFVIDEKSIRAGQLALPRQRATSPSGVGEWVDGVDVIDIESLGVVFVLRRIFVFERGEGVLPARFDPIAAADFFGRPRFDCVTGP